MDNLYFSRFVVVEAMQTAEDNPLVAEKDKEDQNRRVCQWLDEKGFTVDMSRSCVLVELEGCWNTLPCGTYVIFLDDDSKQLLFFSKEEFDKRYEKAG